MRQVLKLSAEKAQALHPAPSQIDIVQMESGPNVALPIIVMQEKFDERLNLGQQY